MSDDAFELPRSAQDQLGRVALTVPKDFSLLMRVSEEDPRQVVLFAEPSKEARERLGAPGPVGRQDTSAFPSHEVVERDGSPAWMRTFRDALDVRVPEQVPVGQLVDLRPFRDRTPPPPARLFPEGTKLWWGALKRGPILELLEHYGIGPEAGTTEERLAMLPPEAQADKDFALAHSNGNPRFDADILPREEVTALYRRLGSLRPTGFSEGTFPKEFDALMTELDPELPQLLKDKNVENIFVDWQRNHMGFQDFNRGERDPGPRRNLRADLGRILVDAGVNPLHLGIFPEGYENGGQVSRAEFDQLGHSDKRKYLLGPSAVVGGEGSPVERKLLENPEELLPREPLVAFKANAANGREQQWFQLVDRVTGEAFGFAQARGEKALTLYDSRGAFIRDWQYRGGA